MKNRLFSLLAVCLAGSRVIAQPVPVPLDRAIQMALQNNKSLKLAEARVTAAQDRLQQVRDQNLPQAKASLAYSHYNLVSPFSIPGGDNGKPLLAIPTGSFDVTQGGVTISKELFGGFAEQSARRSADLLAQASRLDADRNRAELTYTVTEAYCNIVKLIRSSAIVAQNIRQFDEKAREAKSLENQGIVTANEVLKIQLQRNNLQLSQLELDKARETALYNLGLLIGQPDQQPIAVDTLLAEQATAEYPLADYMAKALQNRPELQANALRVQAAQSDLRNVKSSMYPHLGISGGYTYLNPTARLLPEKGSYVNALNVGLGLTYNIGSLYNLKGRLHEAQNNIVTADLVNQQKADQIRNEVVAEFNNYRLAQEKLNVIKTALAQAQENYRLTESRFRNGLVLSSDLLESNGFLVQSQLNLLNATVDTRLAYQRLQKAVGNSLN